MTIAKLNIHDFRNIHTANISPSPKFNFIIGDNGSGKTSFLEAIYMLGHGRAFRHQLSNRIIQHDKPQLVLFSEIISSVNKTHTIGLSKARNGDNKIKIDNDEGFKLAELAKLLPMQLITPEGFDLLIGGPKYRRAFIDWGCFHHYGEFITFWNNLRRLLKQRNALLKRANNYEQLKPWDKELVPVANQISLIRNAYIKQIHDEIIKTSHDFLPEYELDCQFYQGWESSLDYAQLLAENFERDKLFSYTTVGPHKADLKLRINSTPVEVLFSRGQLKLLMCALRLAQGEFYAKHNNQACLYLIDDFASELDLSKRALLAKRLKLTDSQVFISAVDQEQIQPMIDENDKIFYIRSGIISE
ncbi:DNA replication/repair protein RecF [Orbus sturtevantii]|uniref:DNA replication/repair protein RecF n=1 Tax=Orbus sturtevantii TaxID=3074109 RepID=UPI00370DBA60